MEQDKNKEVHITSTETSTVSMSTENAKDEEIEKNEADTAVKKEALKKLLIIGAALVVLFLLAFGLVRILPRAMSSLAAAGTTLTSVFKPKDTLELTTSPSTVSTGEEFTIAWNHKNKDLAGKYAFSYECVDKVSIEHTFPNGQKVAVPCNTAFVLPQDKDTLPFKATLSESNTFADVPLTVTFTENGKTKAGTTGVATITLQSTASYGPRASTTPTLIVSPKTTSTTTVSRPRPTSTNTTVIPVQPTGKADLLVTNSVAGFINTSTNQFVPGTINQGARGAMQFEVSNVGTRASGIWRLTIVLPTTPAQTVVSPTQVSLAPGDRLLFTLAFDNAFPQNDNTVVIHIDSSNQVTESNEANNFSSVIVHQGIVSTNTSAPDLTVRIIDTGTIIGNNFVAVNPIPNGSRGAVRFEIENKGGAYAGSWFFKANLPTGEPFTSVLQSPLRPGEKKSFTLAFDAFANSNNNISIMVDPQNQISESQENNNDTGATVIVR